MAFAFTVKLPDGSSAKGNISTNSSRIALSRLAQEMTQQLTAEEIESFTEVKLRMIGANDSFRRIPPATAEGNGGTAGAGGSAGVAAAQAASRPEKGKTSRK